MSEELCCTRLTGSNELTTLVYCFYCGYEARACFDIAYHHQRGVMDRVTRIDTLRDTRDLIMLYAIEADVVYIVLFGFVY